MEARMELVVMFACGFVIALASYGLGFKRGVDMYHAKLQAQGKIFNREEAQKMLAASDLLPNTGYLTQALEAERKAAAKNNEPKARLAGGR
jgi:hypothetical protein